MRSPADQQGDVWSRNSAAGKNAGELLIVAVESSADLHGAAVLRELKILAPELHAFGSAGPLMREQGCEALVRAESLGVMGIVEVLPAIPQIFRALKMLRLAAQQRRPRAALLIDSPDFNLRLAKKLRPLQIPIAYFIGPSVWAWRRHRVKQIARDIARMLVILPFESAFYAQHGVRADYVGNPLADRLLPLPAPASRDATRPDEVRTSTNDLATPMDALHANDRAVLEADALARPERKRALGLDPSRPALALLPGSRRQEIARLWQPMLEAASILAAENPALQFAVPVAPGIEIESLRARADADAAKLSIQFVDGRAPELLAACDAAVVASGTATLEAALQLIPLVVVYRISWLSYFIARLLVRVKYISLPNLLADRALLPELIQGDCTPRAIASRIEPLLKQSQPRDEMRESLLKLRRLVAPEGAPNVARKVAEEILELLA